MSGTAPRWGWSAATSPTAITSFRPRTRRGRRASSAASSAAGARWRSNSAIVSDAHRVWITQQEGRTLGLLEDKVVVVTGAGGGIGRGIALLLASEGEIGRASCRERGCEYV